MPKYLDYNLPTKISYLISAAILFLVVVHFEFYNLHTVNAVSVQNNQGPKINDPKLKVELLSTGIKFPTSMAFLGPDDLLVLEKNIGTVRRIVNGVMLPKPLLDVNVATKYERGMLGIAIAQIPDENRPRSVFLYYTEAATKDGDDSTEGKTPLGNRLYRYELAVNNTKLADPKLLLDLPATPGPDHNGGKIEMGPDKNVYLVIGDVNGHMSKVENVRNGTNPDGTGGILRISPNGKPVEKGILGDKYPLNLYYAYGIRNSFGIDFDPVTGILWDTENGLGFGDEINLVLPGFNSGWNKVQGIWHTDNHLPGDVISSPDNLVNFGGKGKYAEPKLTTNHTISPTAIKFLNSDKLGKQYENDVFIGSFNNGNFYHFDLNKNRTGLYLDGSLEDRVSNDSSELKNATFGHGFGGITDIQVGPDGYLYVLSIYASGPNCDPRFPDRKQCISYDSSIEGTIFRIVPSNESNFSN